ncbi:unnamed protein product [Clavelina lepadiformis]|uniref:BTB domain-containing protein n=1 Tax=Clavelina lepadiformis TaxID=159417 RepID=A0ABP0GYT5_CLALP
MLTSNSDQHSLYDLFGKISTQVDILHCVAMMNSLQNQQQSDDHCDFTICIVNDGAEKNFRIHRCLISALSEILNEMSDSITKIELNVSEKIWKWFMCFLYGGKIHAVHAMTAEEVKQIWELSDSLKSSPLKQYLARERPDVEIPDDMISTVSFNVCSVEEKEKMDEAIIIGQTTEDTPVNGKKFRCENLKTEQSLNPFVVENETSFPIKIDNLPAGNNFESPAFNMECDSDDDQQYDNVTDLTKYSPSVELHDFNESEFGKNENKNRKPQRKVKKRQKGFTAFAPTSSSKSSKLEDKRKLELSPQRKKEVQHNTTVPSKNLNKVERVDKKPSHKKIPDPKLLQMYEEDDIDLLRELKLTAPNACVFSLIPNL